MFRWLTLHCLSYEPKECLIYMERSITVYCLLGEIKIFKSGYTEKIMLFFCLWAAFMNEQFATLFVTLSFEWSPKPIVIGQLTKGHCLRIADNFFPFYNMQITSPTCEIQCVASHYNCKLFNTALESMFKTKCVLKVSGLEYQ